MASDPSPINRGNQQPANPFGDVQHCCACYQKSLDWDKRRCDEIAEADVFMRAMEVLELDAGKCSQDVRDEAERIIKEEFERRYPKKLAVPKF